jgi:hypothetical protein
MINPSPSGKSSGPVGPVVAREASADTNGLWACVRCNREDGKLVYLASFTGTCPHCGMENTWENRWLALRTYCVSVFWVGVAAVAIAFVVGNPSRWWAHPTVDVTPESVATSSGNARTAAPAADNREAQPLPPASQGDFAQRYAEQASLGMLHGGVCENLRELILRTADHMNVPENVRVRQIDTLVDSAERARCIVE